MSDEERFTLIERIRFGADGSSDHVYEWPNGTTTEKHFDVAPIMFRRGWGLETATDAGVTSVTVKTPSLPYDIISLPSPRKPE